MYVLNLRTYYTVEPGEKPTHVCRLPDLKFSPIFVLRPFMKSFRCELCAWGTLNMSGDVKKNASVFLVCKVIGFCPFLVVFRFSGPVLCHKNILGCLIRYFHWECLALGACSTSFDNSELMPGPQRFLLSMSTRIDRRPARLTLRNIRSTCPPLARQNHLVAPLGTN